MKATAPDFPEIHNKHLRKLYKEQYERGMKEGIEEGLISTAHKMIDSGFSDTQIMDLTGLKPDQLKALRKN